MCLLLILNPQTNLANLLLACQWPAGAASPAALVWRRRAAACAPSPRSPERRRAAVATTAMRTRAQDMHVTPESVLGCAASNRCAPRMIINQCYYTIIVVPGAPHITSLWWLERWHGCAGLARIPRRSPSNEMPLNFLGACGCACSCHHQH